MAGSRRRFIFNIPHELWTVRMVHEPKKCGMQTNATDGLRDEWRFKSRRTDGSDLPSSVAAATEDIK